MKNKTYLKALVLLSAAAAVGCVVSAKSGQHGALAISNSRADPRQAVTAAGQHTGNVSRTEYERPKGRWVFDAKAVKGAPVWT